MANFEEAIAFVLSNEGGYVDNPNDAGGATNFGISLRFLQSLPVESLKEYGFFGDLIAHDVEVLSEEKALAIYRGEFWDRAPFGEIHNQNRANYIFDCCVNHGLAQGIKLVQRASWPRRGEDHRIVDDGIMGEKTLAVINDDACLLMVLMAERAGYMRMLAEVKPKNKEFLHGWLKRCYRI